MTALRHPASRRQAQVLPDHVFFVVSLNQPGRPTAQHSYVTLVVLVTVG
jgi:hypothetical protein